jgi:hypothetical protein
MRLLLFLLYWKQTTLLKWKRLKGIWVFKNKSTNLYTRIWR